MLRRFFFSGPTKWLSPRVMYSTRFPQMVDTPEAKKGVLFDVPLTTHRNDLRYNRRQKPAVDDPKLHLNEFKPVIAFTISQSINTTEAKKLFASLGSYFSIKMPTDLQNTVLVVTPQNSTKIFLGEKLIFLFRNGSVVFWNVPEDECRSICKSISKACHDPLPEKTIEMEELRYAFTDANTHIKNDDLFVHLDQNSLKNEEGIEEDQLMQLILDKYTLSDALSLSVKLNMLENTFDAIAVQMEPWIIDMRNGLRATFRRQAVLRKTGELFTVKHSLNVSTYLTETPDVYWERPVNEVLFNQLKSHLSIPSRVKILNSKLDMCCELTEILSCHLTARHSSRLEWMIILLILVEVLFAIINQYEKYQDRVPRRDEKNSK